MLVGTTSLLSNYAKSVLGIMKKKPNDQFIFVQKCLKRVFCLGCFDKVLHHQTEMKAILFFYQIQQPIILWTCFRSVNHNLVNTLLIYYTNL